MNVIKEILEWSKGRPTWQRDALRRIIQSGELIEEDINDLCEICKNHYGLSDLAESNPLSKDHIKEKDPRAVPVKLLSIFHHHGVNALAEDQTLKFSPGLTVVYGDNAAGKTGYIRILKSACRTRGQEEILGNVISGLAPHAPVVSIRYRIGTESESREWSGNGEDDFVSRVSVFDTKCASVYLTEKTDVAFRPFGLDLFDKLVQACKAIRLKLESEQATLSLSIITDLLTQIPEGTSVSKLLMGITSLTKPDKVQNLANLSTEEESRLVLLEKSLLDLQVNDSEKLIRQLTLRVERVKTLSKYLKNVETVLSSDAIESVFNARAKFNRKNEEAKRLRAITFPAGLLDGTGSEPWKELWESARQFSQLIVYPNQVFPFVEIEAKCVLCQQDLDHETCQRLKKFEAFVVSSTEQELIEIKKDFNQQSNKFSELETTNETIDELLKDIRIENESVADAIVEAISVNEKRREIIAKALISDAESKPDYPALIEITTVADRHAEYLEERIKTLRYGSSLEKISKLKLEIEELSARKLLAKNQEIVLKEIERKKKYAAYGLCIDDTKTKAITLKSAAVTREAVTQKLKQSFKEELLNLTFRHIEVEIKEVGGAEGVLYHKIILTRAPGVELPKVVSEGEQRCLSIAAFLAELSTADDLSGIVFDDPVSSLDYKWREGVANRLVEEAKNRQIIVFTHDIVFLLLLKQFSNDQGVKQLDQYVRQLPIGAGVCAEELPWVALKVSKRIGHIKKLFQEAEKLHRQGHQSVYEREASLIYGYLREAWERGLEEVLLGGIVERYRPGIQTQQVTQIADINEDDCLAVEVAMTKCSKWIYGHDQAAAARADIPEPPELKTDIEALESWVDTIRKRRK